MREKYMRQVGELEDRLREARVNEDDLRSDFEMRIQTETVKLENEITRLRDEKDVMATELEDFAKVKAKEEKLRYVVCGVWSGLCDGKPLYFS